MIAIVVFVFLLLFFWEAHGLVAKEYWRELAVFSFLLLIGMVLSILMISEVELPFIESSWIKLYKVLKPGS